MEFLRKLFTPSRDAIWEQLCTQINANYIEGGFLKGAKVQATHGQWTITLDTYSESAGTSDDLTRTTTYTRLRAPYVNPDGFRFSIFPRNWLIDLMKKFGYQDIEVGIPDFDKAFIIKGNNAQKLRELFANELIRKLLLQQRDFNFSVQHGGEYFDQKFPADTDQLVFAVPQNICDLESLKQMFELFAVTLDQLCHIGSAYENKPSVEL